ncbi:MAG: TrkH family potassium uptake protein [Lachnospiraceae bacterium]|nr:TrkH family potassium uptake protein [Lachnospiraceae bacterium]
MKKLLKSFTQTQLISVSFLLVILVGTFLLMLPVSSRAGEWTSFLDSLFTSTSATCVTGLIVFDTYTHWSLFGQCVILLLIQIGGLGGMTLITLFVMVLRKRISLQSRKLMMQSAGIMDNANVLIILKQIAIGTAVFEGIGFVLLATQFIPEFGWKFGIFASLFHAISAFCNAGFDLFGRISPCSSLTYFSNNVVVNLTIIGLIVIGGIGFLVWNDIYFNKGHLKKYQLHTKVVLTATAILIGVGWILFFITERNNAFAGRSLPSQILCALFQSVTTRTAGFNTVDYANLSESGQLLTMILMLIGGSPGSTAGGVKTTTFMLLIVMAVAAAKNKPTTIFHYSIDRDTMRQATSIATIYLFLVMAGAMALCMWEPFPMSDILFEATSAIGTVGLTMGITGSLSAYSKILIALLMYIGRIGGLSFALSLSEQRRQAPMRRPYGKISIG